LIVDILINVTKQIVLLKWKQ